MEARDVGLGVRLSFFAGRSFASADHHFRRTQAEDHIFPVAKKLGGGITLLLKVISEFAS